MKNKVSIGNFDYLQENGNWIYKSKEPGAQLLNKKKPGYQEKPQLPIQNTIENSSKQVYRKSLHLLTLEITRYLKQSL